MKESRQNALAEQDGCMDSIVKTLVLKLEEAGKIAQFLITEQLADVDLRANISTRLPPVFPTITANEVRLLKGCAPDIERRAPGAIQTLRTMSGHAIVSKGFASDVLFAAKSFHLFLRMFARETLCEQITVAVERVNGVAIVTGEPLANGLTEEARKNATEAELTERLQRLLALERELKSRKAEQDRLQQSRRQTKLGATAAQAETRFDAFLSEVRARRPRAA